jgi:hypothetical protein
MTRKSLLTSAIVAAALASVGGAPAVSNDDDHGRHDPKRRFKAELRGFEEVPAVSTLAHGSVRLRINRDENEIAWRLEYQDLQGNVTQSHIHVGAHHTTGGISVWFCNATATPPATIPAPQACPPAPQGGPPAVLTGTFTSADVAGPNAQLVAPGELAELIKAIRSGVAYANVHSTLVPGGEIRGALKADE